MSDRREQIEAAFEQHETAAEEQQTNESGDPEVPETAVEVVEPAEKPGEGDKPADKELQTEKPLPADGEPKAAVAKPEKTPKAAEIQPAQRAALAGWKPEVREKFASLPKEVQDEVVRRETEISQAMRQNADVRQYATKLQQTIAPYEAMIRAEGGDHYTAVDNLLKTAYHLRTANPQQKALMVANMIQQHGVDVNFLDQALSNLMTGKQQQMAQDPMAQYFQKQLEPLQQQLSRFTQAEQQATQRFAQQAQQETAAFAADPKNEFFEDVRSTMADFIDAAAKMGQKMTLQDAYARATLAHPTISPIVMQRQMSAQAAQRSAAARKAKTAAASLPSGGAPAGEQQNTSSKPRTVRSAIEAAWEAVENKED